MEGLEVEGKSDALYGGEPGGVPVGSAGPVGMAGGHGGEGGRGGIGGDGGPVKAEIVLEHAVGFAGRLSGGLTLHPNAKEYVCAAGGTVIVADLNDAHQQTFLRGHDGPITCLATSPRGTMLASGEAGRNADVVVWDFASKEMIFRLSEHDHGLACVAFSHDERLLVTVGCNDDGRLFVWDLKTGSIVANEKAPPGVTTVSFGGYCKDVKRRDTESYQFVTGGRRHLQRWVLDPYSGSCTKEMINSQVVRDITCLSWSDNFEHLFAGSTSGDVACVGMKYLSVVKLAPCCEGGVQSITSSGVVMEESPGTISVVVGGGDGSVVAYEVDASYTFTEADAVTVGPRDDKWKVMSVSRLPGPDGLEVLAGVEQGYIYRLKWRNLSLAHLACENHSAGVRGVAYAPGVSEWFVTCSDDTTVRVWDASDYSVVAKAHVRDFTAPAVPTSVTMSVEAILSGWSDGKIRCHGTEDGRQLFNISDAHRGGVNAVQMSANERFVISGGEQGEVRVWELRSRDLVSHLKEHTMQVTSVALFPDDVHAMSCSRDRSLLCWDLRAERRISSHTQRMGGMNAVAVHTGTPGGMGGDATIFTVGQEQKVTRWDLRDPNPVRAVDAGEELRTVAVSPGGRFLATGGMAQSVKLWDAAAPEAGPLSIGVGHSSRIESLAFSADCKQLTSVGDDGNIFVWNLFA